MSEETQQVQQVQDYERFALVMDVGEPALGPAAMRLVQRGVDVLYAADLDEAVLLARQEAHRLGAVVAPAVLTLKEVDEILESVCGRMAAGPGALVLAGLEPEPEMINALQERGLRWALWEPYDERDLRFIVTAAMSLRDGADRRKGLRLPVRIPCEAFVGSKSTRVKAFDLSMAGAYLVADEPQPAGTLLRVDIPLPKGGVSAHAEVRNWKGPGSREGQLPPGMGVCFTRLNPASAERLQAFLRSALERYRL